MATALKIEIRKTVEQIRAAFECAICLEILDQPVMTKCGHLFCRNCLFRSLNKQSLTAACPLCKKVVSKRNIQELTLLQEIVSTVRKLSSAHEEEEAELQDHATSASSGNRLRASSSVPAAHTSRKVSARKHSRTHVRKASASTNMQTLSSEYVDKAAAVADVFMYPADETAASITLQPMIEERNGNSEGMSRSGIVSSRPSGDIENVMDTDHVNTIPDPYKFVASQHTPKAHGHRRKNQRRGLEYSMFDDMYEEAHGVAVENVHSTKIRAKRKWKSDGAEKTGFNGDPKMDEVGVISDVVAVGELQRIATVISDAEKYDLVLSQGLKHKLCTNNPVSKPESVNKFATLKSEAKGTLSLTGNIKGKKTNFSECVLTDSVMRDTAFMEDTEYYYNEIEDDHKKVGFTTIVGSENDESKEKTAKFNVDTAGGPEYTNSGRVELPVDDKDKRIECCVESSSTAQKRLFAKDSQIEGAAINEVNLTEQLIILNNSQLSQSKRLDRQLGEGCHVGKEIDKRIVSITSSREKLYSFDGVQYPENSLRLAGKKCMPLGGDGSARGASGFDNDDVAYPASRIDGKISPRSWQSADSDSSGDSTDSMELQTQMLEFESPKPVFEFKKPRTRASVNIKSGKAKRTLRRKTFAIGGCSQRDEPAVPPPDSLDMFNIIGELADIVQQRDGRHFSVSTVEEDLSTQEIDAHLSRDYSTTPRSNSSAEGMCAVQSRSGSAMLRSLPAEGMREKATLTETDLSESESIYEHSRSTQSHLRASSKMSNPEEMKHSTKSTVPFENAVSSPDRNLSHLVPLVGSEISHASSSMSGLSYSVLENCAKLYEPSEVLTVNSESVSQSLSTQDIGLQRTYHAELIENEAKNKKLLEDLNRSQTGNKISWESTNLTPDSQQIETEQTEDNKHCREQTGKKRSSKSKKSIVDETLTQVKTCVRVETSRQGVAGNQLCDEELPTQPNLADDASNSDSEETSSTPVSRRTTLTPSSNLSSQSEFLTTQQQHNLEKEVNSIEREIALLSARLVTGNAPDAQSSLPCVIEEGEEEIDSEADEYSSIEDPSRTADTVQLLEDEEAEENVLILAKIDDAVESKVKDDMSNVGGIVAADNTERGFEQEQPSLVCVSSLMQSDVLIYDEDTINEIPDSLDALSRQKLDAIAPATMIGDGCPSDSDNDLFLSPAREAGRSHILAPVSDGSDKEDAQSPDTSLLYPSRGAKSRCERSTCAPLPSNRSANCVVGELTESTVLSRKVGTASNTVRRQVTRDSDAVAISSNESVHASDQTTQQGTAFNDLSNSPEFSSGRPKSTQVASFPKMPHWTFVVSGISRDSDQPFVDALANKLGCRLMPKFAYGTTHVLVKAVSDGGRRCHRTLKFFQGVAHKAWILNVDWARDCINENKLLPAEKYEILGDAAIDDDHCGPTKARLSSKPLLLHYEVCCYGVFDGLTPDDLRGLLKACGANIIYDPMMFTYDVSLTQVIIVDSIPVDPVDGTYARPVLNPEPLALPLDHLGCKMYSVKWKSTSVIVPMVLCADGVEQLSIRPTSCEVAMSWYSPVYELK